MIFSVFDIRTMTKPIFRLFDFEVLNKEDLDDYNYDGKKFLIKMFGMDEKGKTYSIFVKDFKPFFYVKVPQFWDLRNLQNFKERVKKEVSILPVTAKQ